MFTFTSGMKRTIFSVLLIAHSLISLSQPKLVVGIVVDQMRYDYIDRYWNKFGEGGFKRLVNQGFFCRNTNYNYVPTFTGPGHASIYTGTTPAGHGIVDNEWVNSETGKKVYCAGDPDVGAVGCDGDKGKMSPKNLLSGTVGEELKKGSPQSKVIGIALKDRGAVLPAGHKATAAYWYVSDGNWVTSTYYMKALPQWVSDFNKKALPKKYLSRQWTTVLPIDQYTESDADDNECEQPLKGKSAPVFPYDLPALMKDNGGLGMIRVTPFGNSFTNDFAMAAIANENLGRRKVTDFLCVSFSSPDYIGHQYGPQSIEVEDCYIRFDRDLEDLLKFIDEWIGKDNALVFLTADHGAGEAVPCLWKKNISAGVVDEKTVSDSLKKFFIRTYGDSFLLTVSDFDVYLDSKKIKEKKLIVGEISEVTAQYLTELGGIAYAVPNGNMDNQSFSKGEVDSDSIAVKVERGYYPGRSGDLTYVLKNRWQLGYHKGTSHGSPYSYDTHVPLLWWGYKVPQGNSSEAIAITQIAPTLSVLLGIPVPAACKSAPILPLVK